jgi:hypothetical protein
MKHSAKLQILLWVFCFLFLASCSFRLTADQARPYAIEELEAYCKNFKIDMSLVKKGPEYLGTPDSGYTFEWVADLPGEGKTNIDIWVSPTGETKVTTEKVTDGLSRPPDRRAFLNSLAPNFPRLQVQLQLGARSINVAFT